MSLLVFTDHQARADRFGHTAEIRDAPFAHLARHHANADAPPLPFFPLHPVLHFPQQFCRRTPFMVQLADENQTHTHTHTQQATVTDYDGPR